MVWQRYHEVRHTEAHWRYWDEGRRDHEERWEHQCRPWEPQEEDGMREFLNSPLGAVLGFIAG